MAAVTKGEMSSAGGLGLGSGQHGQPLDTVLCAANYSTTRCSNVGSKACQHCRLVSYCSKDCQTQHWKSHKPLCKSDLMQESWTPSWITESRVPSFVDPEPNVVSPFQECLWGNVPAYGLLGSAHPNSQLPHDLRVCFVASGDLRNVIETVCQIPDDFKGKATVYVNDANAKVMVRNYLMLELLRLHGSHSIDAVIALWYSLALTSAQLKAIKMLARQLCKTSDASDDAEMYEYSGCFGGSGVKCLVAQFGKHALQVLELLCENSMPLEMGKETRRVVMESRRDLADRRMSCLRPAHRLAWYHFRQTGLLLPFASQAAAGADADDHHPQHNKANRFLLTPFLGWTLGDGNDPLDGWDIKQLIADGIRHGVPFNDLYGCLFFHLRSKLQSFLDKWKLCRVKFVLTNVEASELAADLCCKKVSLHRIDTSNLADAHYRGIKRILKDWGALLTKPSSGSSSSSSSSSSSASSAAAAASSSASSAAAAAAGSSVQTLEPLLITCFMNWSLYYNMLKKLTSLHVREEEAAAQRLVEGATTVAELKKAVDKGMKWGRMKQGFKEQMMRLFIGRDSNWYTYFHDFSKAFDEYLGMQAAFQAAQKVGIVRMHKHVTVPHRLFVPISASHSATPALHGSLEDFYLCNVLHFNKTMTERFVEWARTPT